MSASYVCRVTVELDLRADDKADAYETLNAWADAVRDGDGAGVATLQEFQVVRARPSFRFADIQEMHKPASVREPDSQSLDSKQESKGGAA